MSDTGALTGSSAEVWVNGIEATAAVSYSIQRPRQLVRVDVLGRPRSREILTDGETVSVSMELCFMDNEDLRQFGIIGDDPDPASTLLTRNPAAEIKVRDNSSQRIISVTRGLKVESTGMTVRRGAAVMQTCNLQGTIYLQGSEFG